MIRFICILVLLLAFADNANAQDAALQESLRKASSVNRQLRVQLRDSSIVQGTVFSLTRTSVRISTQSIALDSIVSMERRDRHNRGWRRGAVIGGLSGFVVTWPPRNLVSSDGDESATTALSVGGTIVGAL